MIHIIKKNGRFYKLMVIILTLLFIPLIFAGTIKIASPNMNNSVTQGSVIINAPEEPLNYSIFSNNTNYLGGYPSSYFYPYSNPLNFIDNAGETDPLSLLLTGVNWALGSNWLTYASTTLDFNYTKLISLFYNQTQINSMIVNNNTYLRNNTNIFVQNITATKFNLLGITIWQTATTSNINFSINCTEGADCVSPSQVIFPDNNNWTGQNYFDNLTFNLANGLGVTTWQDTTTSYVNFSVKCNATSCVSPPQVILPDVYNFTGATYFNNLAVVNNVSTGNYIYTYKTPATLLNVTGTVVNNSIGNITTFGDNWAIDLTEIVTTGHDLRVNFTGVTYFNSLVTRYWYSGSSSHTSYVQIYNFNTASWNTLYNDIGGSQVDFVDRTFDIPNPTNFISSGNVYVRFTHSANGIATHHLYVDYVGLTN